MYLLSLCDNVDILKILRIVKIAITIIKIVVPIILIVSCMIEGTRAITSNDSDLTGKLLKGWVSKIVAAILIFMIPTFVNILANLGNANTNEITKCLQNSTSERITELTIEQAEKYISIAKESLSYSDYSVAQTYVNKIKNQTDKESYKSELDEIYKEIKKKQEEEKKRASVDKGWYWPVGSKETTTEGGKTFAKGAPSATSITAYFAGNDSVHQGLGGGHGAIDIGASHSSNIIASKSGTVIYPTAGARIDYADQAIKPDENGKYNCSGLHANYVVIDHGDGITTQYGHLYQNTITVKAGDHVEQGQVIGLSGSSGCSTGPHLHFQMEINGTRVDPLNYVSASNPRP